MFWLFSKRGWRSCGCLDLPSFPAFNPFLCLVISRVYLYADSISITPLFKLYISSDLFHHRFRPNIVLQGGGPFAEDAWEEIAIGSKGAPRITLVSKCTRCLVSFSCSRTRYGFVTLVFEQCRKGYPTCCIVSWRWVSCVARRVLCFVSKTCHVRRRFFGRCDLTDGRGRPAYIRIETVHLTLRTCVCLRHHLIWLQTPSLLLYFLFSFELS